MSDWRSIAAITDDLVRLGVAQSRLVLGAADPWAWVNERREAELAALLASAEPFDPLATPAEADVGPLDERTLQAPTAPGWITRGRPDPGSARDRPYCAKQ
jgi:hypothetical protein